MRGIDLGRCVIGSVNVTNFLTLTNPLFDLCLLLEVILREVRRETMLLKILIITPIPCHAGLLRVWRVMPYRILCNVTRQKSLEVRSGLILTPSHFTRFHKIRYGINSSWEILTKDRCWRCLCVWIFSKFFV